MNQNIPPIKYYLSIGSNISPEKNIPLCLTLLKTRYPSICFSQVYETDPVGPAGSDKFWNLAASVVTSETQNALRENLRGIESQLGRVRSANNRFLPRVIDIDILPQPDYTAQAFIMIPLAEIDPLQREESTGKTFGELAESLRGSALNFKRKLV